MRNFLGFLLSLSLLLPNIAFAKSAYESLLDTNSEFKQLDSELNAKFKEIAPTLSLGSLALLRADQRYWIKEGFDAQVTELSSQYPDKKSASVRALEMRVKDFAKLQNESGSKNIAGIPVSFGMTKDEVYGKLDRDKIDPADGSYKMSIMGETANISFHFSKTVFTGNTFGERSSEEFNDYVSRLEKHYGTTLRRGMRKISFSEEHATNVFERLVAVEIYFESTELSRADFNKSFEKKYKRVYNHEYLEKLLSTKMDSLSTPGYDSAFESGDKIIYTADLSGTMQTNFSVVYVDKEYLANGLSPKTLTMWLGRTNDYKSNLVFYKKGEKLFSVIDMLADNVVRCLPNGVTATYDKYDIDFYFDNDALYGFKLYSVDMNDLFDQLQKRLDARLTKYNETDNAIFDYLGHDSNTNSYYDADENFVMIYFEKNVGTCLEVIDKRKLKQLAAQNVAREKEEAIRNKQRDAENKKKFDKEINNF